MFPRLKKVRGYTYVQLVEGHREDGKVKQRVVATLGRLDQLQESGELESLSRFSARYSDSLMLLEAYSRGDAATVSCRRIGPSLIFERLWRETGCQAVINELLEGRSFGFSVERAIFLSVLHRLVDPGSDRAADRWRHSYHVEGTEKLELHHLYRAMAWLGEELPQADQAGRTPFAPRCVKDLIEEELFKLRLQTIPPRVLVLLDTTSVFFHGQGGETLGKHGYSRDYRPQLRQLVLAQVLDESGHPICCEIWPGNTSDAKSILPIVERLTSRFGIKDVCVVADRGMLSASTVKALEGNKLGWRYILGSRMRNEREVRQDVLSRGGRFRVVHGARTKSSDPAPLKVKEVRVGEKRYVVCRNDDQARSDAESRAAILASLQKKLEQGGQKSLVGNSGYRRYLTSNGPTFEISEDAVKREARFDGTWVLRTNTDWPVDFVAFCYKQLWRVEDTHRTLKSIFETRPVFHRRDETIRGHVFCSFLALVLRKALLDRLAKTDLKDSWGDIIDDLDGLTETDIHHQNKTFRLRSTARGAAGAVFQAVGVALPPTIRRLELAPESVG